MRRIITQICALALLVALTAAAGAHEPTGGTPATPHERAAFEGVTFESLASTPPLPLGPPPTSAEMQRITFEPGATLALPYHGPVLYYVERGTLGLDLDGRQLTFTGVGQGEPFGVQEGREIQLSVGQAVYAEDGDLGPVRNAGSEPLVILALVMVPEPAGVGESETVEEVAIPVPATPSPGT